jgi:hypothetical protein
VLLLLLLHRSRCLAKLGHLLVLVGLRQVLQVLCTTAKARMSWSKASQVEPQTRTGTHSWAETKAI